GVASFTVEKIYAGAWLCNSGAVIAQHRDAIKHRGPYSRRAPGQWRAGGSRGGTTQSAVPPAIRPSTGQTVQSPARHRWNRWGETGIAGRLKGIKSTDTP